MRIAQVSYHTNPVAPLGGRHTGGMNVYVHELSRELARLGNHVDIFTRLEGERPEVTPLAPNLRLVQLPAGPAAPLDKALLTPYVPAFVAEMNRFAADEGLSYDLVHSHYWQAIAAGEPFARAQDAPHLVMFHTLGEVKNRARVSEEEPGERIRRERELAASADAIITASGHEHDLLARYYDADPARMVSIPCGIDTDLFRPRDRVECRRALGIELDRPVLLWVGRLEKLKGVDILIDAVAELEDPEILLLVVGGDEHGEELRAELEEQAREAGLAGGVRFTGAVPHEELPAWYSAADVCVVPSYYESFGLVAVEAMACGTPVVASRVGGLVSTVTDGVNGYLIPWRCPEPFAEKLEVLIRNPELRANFARAARDSVQRFRWDEVALRMEALYRGVIAARTGEEVPA